MCAPQACIKLRAPASSAYASAANPLPHGRCAVRKGRRGLQLMMMRRVVELSAGAVTLGDPCPQLGQVAHLAHSLAPHQGRVQPLRTPL